MILNVCVTLDIYVQNLFRNNVEIWKNQHYGPRLKDNGCLLSFTQKKSCPMKLSGPRKRDGVVVLEALSDAKTVRTAFQELNF